MDYMANRSWLFPATQSLKIFILPRAGVWCTTQYLLMTTLCPRNKLMSVSIIEFLIFTRKFRCFATKCFLIDPLLLSMIFFSSGKVDILQSLNKKKTQHRPMAMRFLIRLQFLKFLANQPGRGVWRPLRKLRYAEECLWWLGFGVTDQLDTLTRTAVMQQACHP